MSGAPEAGPSALGHGRTGNVAARVGTVALAAASLAVPFVGWPDLDVAEAFMSRAAWHVFLGTAALLFSLKASWGNPLWKGDWTVWVGIVLSSLAILLGGYFILSTAMIGCLDRIFTCPVGN